MDYTQIRYDVADHIATITLNRPDQLNAFTGTMMRELIDAFDRVDADDDQVRTMLIEYFVPAAEHLRNDTGLPISSAKPAP